MIVSPVLKCRLPYYSFHFNRNVPATSIFLVFYVMIFYYRIEVVSEFVLSSTLHFWKYACFLSTELCTWNTFHQQYVIYGRIGICVFKTVLSKSCLFRNASVLEVDAASISYKNDGICFIS